MPIIGARVVNFVTSIAKPRQKELDTCQEHPRSIRIDARRSFWVGPRGAGLYRSEKTVIQTETTTFRE